MTRVRITAAMLRKPREAVERKAPPPSRLTSTPQPAPVAKGEQQAMPPHAEPVATQPAFRAPQFGFRKADAD